MQEGDRRVRHAEKHVCKGDEPPENGRQVSIELCSCAGLSWAAQSEAPAKYSVWAGSSDIFYFSPLSKGWGEEKVRGEGDSL